MCDERFLQPRELVRAITEENVCENPLFDLVLKALIRAEVRLMSRFIPQRSHEERLTGNLVSEIDNAIFLIGKQFKKTCLALYALEKEIDFFYYDLSRGGTIEKATGADLGLILVVDLPDFPYTVKSLILQAKKISGNPAQIERNQYETLMTHGASECAYLFYDMDLARRCSPLVVSVGQYNLKNGHEECAKKDNDSFSITFDKARSAGHPLSLFVVSHLAYGNSIGAKHDSFKTAFRMFADLCPPQRSRRDSGIGDFNGRLAILSLGRSIRFGTPHNEGMEIDV